MDPRVKDLRGLKFGFLTVTEYRGQHKRGALWTLLCACGKTTTMPSGDISKCIQRKVESSCGCKRKETIGRRNTKHSMSFHPAYRAWSNMKGRCTDPKHQAWKNYGGRGIKVCARWLTSFNAFWEDMGPTYAKGLTLERVHNSRGYSKTNCEWTTVLRQHNNTRYNRLIDTPKGRMTVADAARAYKMGYALLLNRLYAGWSISRALGLSTT